MMAILPSIWHLMNMKQRGVQFPSLSSLAVSTTLDNYYNFAFHTNSTTLCDLTHPMALSILLVLVLMIRTSKEILLPKLSLIGRNIGRATHGDEWERNNSDRIVKFGEYLYRLFYHTVLSIYGLWYFHDKSWCDTDQGGTKNLWIDYPNHPVEPGMAWYYLVQSAYNVDALISLMKSSFIIEIMNPFAYSSAMDVAEKEHLVRKEESSQSCQHRIVLWTPLFQIEWNETVRGDFREMFVHHLVTNTLIFLSSHYRFTRVGSTVFMLHDLSDVLGDMSKLAHFMKLEVATIICFVIMVLLWLITRLVIFPFVICKSFWVDSYEYMVLMGTLDPSIHNTFYILFSALLGTLILLNMIWFLMFLRMGWKLIKTGERHDYTEHKRGEKQKAT